MGVTRGAGQRASRAGQGPSPLSGCMGHGSEPGALGGDHDCVGPAGGFPFRCCEPWSSRAPSFWGLIGGPLPPFTAADQSDASRGPCPTSLHAGAFGAEEQQLTAPQHPAYSHLFYHGFKGRGLEEGTVRARVCVCAHARASV